MSRYFVFAAIGAALALTACEQPCPNQPSQCSPSATVTFTLPDGPPRAFEVRVRIVENGEEQTDRCLLLAPLPADWPANGISANCLNSSVSLYWTTRFETSCDPNVTPTPDGVQIGNECSTSTAGRELVLRRSGVPELIELELSENGEAFQPLAISPVYDEVRPDGEHCSARCQEASESRSFDELTQPLAAEP